MQRKYNGSTPLPKDLTKEDFKSYHESIKKFTGNTLYSYVTRLRSFGSFLKTLYKQDESMAAEIPFPRVLRGDKETLEHEVFQAVYDSIEDVLHKAMFAFLYYDHLRVASACRLRYCDIRLEDNTKEIEDMKRLQKKSLRKEKENRVAVQMLNPRAGQMLRRRKPAEKAPLPEPRRKIVVTVREAKGSKRKRTKWNRTTFPYSTPRTASMTCCF